MSLKITKVCLKSELNIPCWSASYIRQYKIDVVRPLGITSQIDNNFGLGTGLSYESVFVCEGSGKPYCNTS